MSGTSDIVCRGCPREVVRAAKVEAARQGISLKAFVVAAIQMVLGGGTADAGLTKRSAGRAVGEAGLQGTRKVPPVTGVETLVTNVGSNPTLATKTDQVPIPGMKCQFCSWGVYEFKDPNTGAVRLKCLGPKVHTMSKPHKEPQ